MGILSYINQRKEQFKNKINEIKINKVKEQTKELEQEKIRQSDLNKALQDKQKIEKEISPIKKFNTENTGKSKLLLIGENLSKTLNKASKSKGKNKINSQFSPFNTSSSNKNPFGISQSGSPFNQNTKSINFGSTKKVFDNSKSKNPFKKG